MGNIYSLGKINNSFWSAVVQHNYAEIEDSNDNIVRYKQTAINTMLSQNFDNSFYWDLGVRGYYESRYGGDPNKYLYEKYNLNKTFGVLYEDILTKRVEADFQIGYSFNRNNSMHFQTVESFHKQNSDFSYTNFLTDEYMSFNNLYYKYNLNNHTMIIPGIQYHYELVNDSQRIENNKYNIFSAYIQSDTIYFYPLTILGGIRYDRETEQGYEFSPRLALMYNIFDELSTKLAYGHGFRLSSVFFQQIHSSGFRYYVINNPDIKPEKSDNIDFEIKYEKDPFTISANTYFIYLRDLIQGVIIGRDDSIGKLIYQYRNSAKAYSYGAELNIDMPLFYLLYDANNSSVLDYFFLKIGYAFNESYDINKKERLRFRPVHSANIELFFDNKNWGTIFSLFCEFTGKMDIMSVEQNSNNTQTILKSKSPYYTILNLYLEQMILNNYFSIYFGINNIFGFTQKNWSQDLSYIWGPINGRLFYVGSKLRF